MVQGSRLAGDGNRATVDMRLDAPVFVLSRQDMNRVNLMREQLTLCEDPKLRPTPVCPVCDGGLSWPWVAATGAVVAVTGVFVGMIVKAKFP